MSSVTSDRAVLLMAHGSRDSEARAEYRRIHRALQDRLSPTPVVFSVLEFPGDDGLLSIQDGWRECLAAGAQRVVALPFFLFTAGHVREDLPTELREARASARWAEIDFLPPLGLADELLEAVAARAEDATGGDAGTAVILVGAGTSDPDANGDLCKAARLLWERYHAKFPLVETAWVSLTRPSVGEAIDRCVRLGAQRIALVPYFLNTGVLLKRIDERVAEARAAHPTASIVRGQHLGLHSGMLDLIERRARAGLRCEIEQAGLMAVCGRASCTSIARGRSRLLSEEVSASR